MSILQWVIVDGQPRRVSAFASLPPRKRPRATCPVCARPVILKLGSVLEHHAAHASGAICAATQPETALHINCKLAIAEALRRVTSLEIRRRCVECDRSQVIEWMRDWDQVLIEMRIDGARRPDIVLRRAGAAIAAIEIVVSHAIDAEKMRALRVPWIEVAGNERLANGEWDGHEPLDVLRASNALDWRCEVHQATRDARQESSRHTSTTVAARVVDIYYEDGRRERLIYRVEELSIDGVAHARRLRRGGMELVETSIGESGWPTVREGFREDVARFARHDGSFADSPMRWARGNAALNIVEEALTDRVGRDPTPLATRFPRRWFFARERKQWFLPPEMRDVRWDRPSDDVFAAHPAWSRARSAVREHPAPEGSWDTPVFAARPVAGIFRERIAHLRPVPGLDSVSLVELSHNRIIAVVERSTDDAAIRELATAFSRDASEVIWISHPLDWTAAFSSLAWCPAGRDGRGRGGVVIDGVGIFTANQFARAVANGDPRVAPAAIRRQMAPRVSRLMA